MPVMDSCKFNPWKVSIKMWLRWNKCVLSIKSTANNLSTPEEWNNNFNHMFGELDSQDTMRISIVACLRKQYSFVVSPARFYSCRENDMVQWGEISVRSSECLQPLSLPILDTPLVELGTSSAVYLPYWAPSWLPELPHTRSWYLYSTLSSHISCRSE